jgi:hypothetical protein
MELIVPSRSSISERFPIASFMVRVPSARYFEVVCATDPRLFHTSYAGQRTSDNFYTSRSDGMLVCEEGENTFFIPPQQLRRFAGARRIYYALGTYGGRNGENPRFSISPNALDQVPSIGIGPDFTGRTLDRTRIGRDHAEPALYGGRNGAALRWGGDAVLDAEEAASKQPESSAESYDDGYDASLWNGSERGSESLGDEGSSVADEPSSEFRPSAALTWSESAGGDADEYRDGDGDGAEYAGAANYVGGFVGVGGYGAADVGGDYDDPANGAPVEHAFSADEDADAAQDDADGQSLAYEDGDGEARDADLSLAADDSSDDYSSDLGVDPEDAEDAAEHREQQLRTEPRAGASGWDSDSAQYGHPGAHAAATLGEKEASYQEEEAPEHELPVGPASLPLDVLPLTVAEKVRILRVVGRADSGAEGYGAVNADTEYNDPKHSAYRLTHIGLSWGFVMFTQRSGALGRVLSKALEREQAAGTRPESALPEGQRLAALFGPEWRELIRRCDPEHTPDPDLRVESVAGKVLWEEPWLGRFRAAGRAPHVQAAQNEVAVVDYFDRMLPMAGWLGLTTARGLALLVDRAVHMGVGSAEAWVMNAVGPVHTEADRRAALAALGFEDLRSFQRSEPSLVASGRWNAQTHAALVSALRRLGDRSPIPVPTRAVIQRALGDAARGTPFESRVRALLENSAELDDENTFVVG